MTSLDKSQVAGESFALSSLIAQGGREGRLNATSVPDVFVKGKGCGEEGT